MKRPGVREALEVIRELESERERLRLLATDLAERATALAESINTFVYDEVALGLVRCQSSDCRKQFVPKRGNQDRYCSHRCRNREARRRQRAKVRAPKEGER